MPKKAGSDKIPKRSAAQLKKAVDRLDKELVKVLNERAATSQQLGATEASDAASPFVRSELISKAASASKGPLSEAALQSIFREIESECRALLKPTRVAFLGPTFSYSYLATIERFGECVDLIPVATIAAVFDELSRGHVDYGVVPLENSTDGRVVDTLGMFARMPVRICGEVQLRIRHSLLAKCRREQIREVHSKPQALSQCRDWLALHLPKARAFETTSTATAAQLAAEKAGVAAVAGRHAASVYGLDIVAEDIQDNRNNVTRFAIIGGDAVPQTGHDKTAIMFEIPHEPGSLANAMGIFKRSRLNMTWIESFPLAGADNEYLFFIEFEGHQDDADARHALASLKRKTVRLEVLGSYATSEPLA